MNCAFNLDLIYDFSKELTAADSFKILHDYQIKNLYETEIDKESIANFNAELIDDYFEKRANFLSYLRPGLNARIAWELRKSAILWKFMEGDKDPWFFEAHKADWGVQEIKE